MQAINCETPGRATAFWRLPRFRTISVDTARYPRESARFRYETARKVHETSRKRHDFTRYPRFNFSRQIRRSTDYRADSALNRTFSRCNRALSRLNRAFSRAFRGESCESVRYRPAAAVRPRPGCPFRCLPYLSTFATSTISTPCNWPSQLSNHGLCETPTIDRTRAPGRSRKVSRMLATMRRLRISQPATHICG